MRRFAILLFLVPLVHAPAAAQDAPLVLRLPASARALALGGVLPPGAADPAAIFYHAAFAPAGIAAGTQWLGGDTLAIEAAGAMEWLGGTVAIGVRSVSFTADCRCAWIQVLPGPPQVPVSERAAQVTYGRTFKGLRLALTGKCVDQRWDVPRGSGWAVDASAGHEIGPLRLALTGQNLGPNLDVGGVSVPLNRRILLAAAPPGSAPLGPLDVLPAVQLAWERGARFTPAAGVELRYWPVVGRTFYLRGGVRRPDTDAAERAFTLGAGFSGDRITLDYALAPLAGGRATHRIGLGWR